MKQVVLIQFVGITKERQVPYQVPYEVEKQRTVTQTKKMPPFGRSSLPVNPLPVEQLQVEEEPANGSTAKLAYQEDFNNPPTGWPTLSIGEYEMRCQDGGFRILVKMPNDWAWAYHPSTSTLTNYAIEVDARPEPRLMRCCYYYGIVFGYVDDDNYRLFCVDGIAGEYQIVKISGGTWSNLIDWTYPTYISARETDHLKVVCKGPEISVYANGSLLATVTDNSLQGGRAGMVAGTRIVGDRANVLFDNFKVYVPD